MPHDEDDPAKTLQHQQIRVALTTRGEAGAQDAPPLTRLTRALCGKGVEILGMAGENVRGGGYVRILVSDDQLPRAIEAVHEADLEPERVDGTTRRLADRRCSFADIAHNPNFDAFLVGCELNGRLVVQLTKN